MMQKKKILKKPLKNHNFCRVLFVLFICNWSVSLTAGSPLNFLSQEEQKWLNNLSGHIKVGITHMPNQVLYQEKSSYTGFSIELFHNIESLLNIKFKWVYFETWDELIEAGKSKDIDIIFAAQKTPSRLSYFYFTDTFLIQQNKIIISSGTAKQITIQQLFNIKTALAKGSAIFEYLKSNYPDIILIPTETELDALKMVASKKAGAAISETVRAAYYIKKYNLKNLYIAGDIGYNYNLRIANRNDLPILNTILNKTLAKIPVEKKKTLNLKWGYSKDKINYFDKQTLIYIGIIAGILIPFSIYMALLNHKLKKAHARIEELHKISAKEARIDELTQIPNRRYFNELISNKFSEFKRESKTFSFIMLDIDFFKNINDEYGHDVGDKVLVKTAEIITRLLREHDNVGRLGGEEFGVMLSNTSISLGIEIAERLRKLIENNILNINKQAIKVTASFGVVEINANDSISSLYKRADDLLYQSKKEGRNRVSYTLLD